MMRFTPLTCPTCQAPAHGTVERLAGVALLTEPDEKGRVDYAGSTEIWWDEQRSVTDKRGRVRLICPAGHEWWADGFNPHLVPSIVVNGTREPLCRPCVEAANPRRVARGLAPIAVLPGAYEPAVEGEEGPSGSR